MRHLAGQAPALAHGFEIARAAECSGHSVRRCVRCTASHQYTVGQAAVHRHGGLSQQRSRPHAMRPGLAAEARLDAQHLGNTVNVLPSRTADLHDKAVDVLAAKAGVGECLDKSVGEETGAATLGSLFESSAADSDDGSL